VLDCIYKRLFIFATDGCKFNLIKTEKMKKLLTLVLGLMIGISLTAQQVPRDMVVVEGGTGFW